MTSVFFRHFYGYLMLTHNAVMYINQWRKQQRTRRGKKKVEQWKLNGYILGAQKYLSRILFRDKEAQIYRYW